MKSRKVLNPKKRGRKAMDFKDKKRSVSICISPLFIKHCGDELTESSKQKDLPKTMDKIYKFIENEINEIP